MKLATCITVILFFTLPAIAGDDIKTAPLRVQFVTADSIAMPGAVSIQGKATLIDQPNHTIYAIDFSGTCSFMFATAPTTARIMQPAKWKKADKLTVWWKHPGSSDKWDRCDLSAIDRLPHQAYISDPGGYRLVSDREFAGVLTGGAR
jgi:hypothetical protein